MSASYITDGEGNVVYPKTLAKCVNKGGSTLEEYLNDVEDATLIKPTVQGTNMMITDSSDRNIQELHIYGKTEQRTTTGKNVFNANEVLSTFIEDGRVTVTGEGVLINGTFGATNRNFNITLKKGTYYISGGGILHILAPGDSIFDKKIIVEEEEKTFQCYITSNTYSNKLIQPQIESGSVATNYEPYTGGIASPNPDYPQGMNCVENPTVSIAGKNLAITQNVSGSNNLINAKIVRGQKYTLSFDCNKRVAMNINSKRQNGTNLRNINPLKIGRNSCSFIAIDDGDIFFNCYGSTDDTNDLQINNIQIERGDTSSDYEPCKEIQSAQQTCKLNGIDDVRDELIVRADGTGQLIQRLLKEELNNNSDLRTWYETTKTYGYQTGESKWLFMANKINVKSNKLKGITKEVGNSGAYNENGIFVNTAGCINFKILKKYLTKYTVDALKTYLRDNPITVVGLLKEPIVTELSAEEVQKLLVLHTNKPNTTIWNDQNAEMQITYVADAKNYIDNKFTELENSISSTASITALEDCKTE